MWNVRLKPYLVAIAICLHLGIAVLMGLISFSATMIACDLAVLADGQLLAVKDFCSPLFHRISGPAERKLSLNDAREVVNH
jgi:hypothetical protein